MDIALGVYILGIILGCPWYFHREAKSVGDVLARLLLWPIWLLISFVRGVVSTLKYMLE